MPILISETTRFHIKRFFVLQTINIGNMDHSDKTREELISELKEITNLSKVNRQKYEEEILFARQAEARANRSEEIFRKAFLVSPDSVNINRLSDGFFVSVNEGFTKIMGFTEEDVLGKTSLDLNIWVNSGDRFKLVAALEKSGKVENFEADFRSKDGSVINGSMSASHIDIDGVPHILNITKDITEKKNLEEALRLKQMLLEAIINNSPDQIFYKDSDSRFVFCNKPVALLAGCESEDDMIGKSDFDFYPEHMARQYFNDEQKIMKIGEPLLNHEEQVVDKKTGEMKWNLTSKVPVRDSEGKIIGLAGFNRDITARKRTELENQVFYEISQGYTSSDNLQDFLSLIHGSLSKVVYAENCFVALYDQKTVLFSFPYFVDKFDTVPLPTSMLKSCTAYVFRKGKPFLFTQDDFDHLVELNEVELVGSASPSWIGIPLQTPSQTIGVIVLQHYKMENVYSEKDVKILMTIGRQIAIAIERKKSEEEIKLKNELLEALNKEKDKFFSIIADDLRGPLSAFVAATQILEEDIQNMTFEEIRDITISMKTDAVNVYRLLENLLEWSRLQRGVLEFNPVKLTLLNEINASLESVSSLANKKGILIEVLVNDDLEITADSHMLTTVIRNIITNAVKFTPHGGKVMVSAKTNKDNSIEISVTDTGIGMTQDMKNKLFHMNEKTGRKGTDGEASSGLGLLLCKEFVGKHNGKILVESEVDKGSSFKILIP